MSIGGPPGRSGRARAPVHQISLPGGRRSAGADSARTESMKRLLAVHRTAWLTAVMVQGVQRISGSGHRVPGRRARLRAWSGILVFSVLFIVSAPACSAASVAGHGPSVSAGPGQQETAAAATAARLPTPVRCDSCWYPPVHESWQIQLSSTPTAPFLPPLARRTQHQHQTARHQTDS